MTDAIACRAHRRAVRRIASLRSVLLLVLVSASLARRRADGRVLRRRAGREGRSPTRIVATGLRPAGTPRAPAVRGCGLGPQPDRRASSWPGSRRMACRTPPEADRTTLLRRLSFDLIGLPPTPGGGRRVPRRRLAATPTRTQVDRLLASPHYGERWAQHWLDLARYADTDGFEFDQARPDAWRYRDWVVAALNDDMPYDRFVRLQLAGDEVRPDDPAAFIATGFNRCYPDMVDLNDQGLRRQNALNDITETTGLVFLGLTIGCAAVPRPQVRPDPAGRLLPAPGLLHPGAVPGRLPDRHDGRARGVRAGPRVVGRRGRRDPGRGHPPGGARPRRPAPGLPPGLNDDATAAFQKPEAERTPDEVRVVFEALAKDRRIDPEAWTWPSTATSATIRRRARWPGSTACGRPRRPRLPRPAGSTRPARRRRRPTSCAAAITRRRGPRSRRRSRRSSARPSRPRPRRSRPSPRSTGRRRALADWLVRPDHPLTARVMVNRLWQGHFGRGIVATPSDFGTMGDEPSHPELLDWLATEFVRRRLEPEGDASADRHQRHVSPGVADSTAPRCSPIPRTPCSAASPRRRLDGEAIRDALLAVSGRLNPALGGPASSRNSPTS